MNIPSRLLYTKTHEWVDLLDDNTAIIGLTDHAQEALGDLVFVNLPDAGSEVTAGSEFADVESVKSASEVFSPVTGTVTEINEELLDEPEKINEDAYGAWFIKVSNITEKAELITAEEYEAFVLSEEE